MLSLARVTRMRRDAGASPWPVPTPSGFFPKTCAAAAPSAVAPSGPKTPVEAKRPSSPAAPPTICCTTRVLAW
ncbi:MAG: hypothetical protein SFW67_03370 [Myxococcaceae bacterium]|nr:hypothetical protein [Myxococcaceae bacterium]